MPYSFTHKGCRRGTRDMNVAPPHARRHRSGISAMPSVPGQRNRIDLASDDFATTPRPSETPLSRGACRDARRPVLVLRRWDVRNGSSDRPGPRCPASENSSPRPKTSRDSASVPTVVTADHARVAVDRRRSSDGDLVLPFTPASLTAPVERVRDDVMHCVVSTMSYALGGEPSRFSDWGRTSTATSQKRAGGPPSARPSR